MCNSIADCNDRGYCSNKECLCDVAWFGDFCEENLKLILPNAFVTYKAIFLIIYSIIFLLSFYRLWKKIKKERDLFARSTFIFMLKSLRSPYNLTMLSIWGISLTRILWTAIDPFGYHDRISRSLERVLFETTYSLLFVIYVIVLWVWGSIYEELSRRVVDKGPVSLIWFRRRLKFFVVLVIAVQITTSILKGYHLDNLRTITLLLYVVLFFVLVIVIIEYWIYGWLLYKLISEQEKSIKEQYYKVKAAGSHATNILNTYDKDRAKEQKERDSSVYKSKRSLGANHEIIINGLKTPKTDELRYLNRVESENVEMMRTSKPATPVKITDFDQIAHQDGHSLDHIEDINLENGQSIHTHTDDMPRTSHFVKSISSPFHAGAKKQTGISKKDSSFEHKVQEIVDRHEAYLKPVDIMEDFSSDNIAAQVSVIFDDNEDVVWDFEDMTELKMKEEQQKRRDIEIEINKKAITTIRHKTIVEKVDLLTKKERIEDIFLRKLWADETYLRNHQEITKNDKKIIKKIFSLTVIAICLETLFVVITILIFGTTILQSPIGMSISMWITGFIEILAILAIVVLFSLVETQEKENLRLIMRIGQNKNRINRLYGFVLPPFLRQEESKRRLERRINQTTAPYVKSFDNLP